jgi:hypothetical protein
MKRAWRRGRKSGGALAPASRVISPLIDNFSCFLSQAAECGHAVHRNAPRMWSMLAKRRFVV